MKSSVPGDKVSGAVHHLYFSTHGTPFVKQLIIAKHNTLVKKHCWKAWNKQIDLWAACKSPSRWFEDRDFKGIKMKCTGIWGESPHNPPLRHEWGGVGVSNDWCITWMKTCMWSNMAQDWVYKIFIAYDGLKIAFRITKKSNPVFAH